MGVESHLLNQSVFHTNLKTTSLDPHPENKCHKSKFISVSAHAHKKKNSRQATQRLMCYSIKTVAVAMNCVIWPSVICSNIILVATYGGNVVVQACSFIPVLMHPL